MTTGRGKEREWLILGAKLVNKAGESSLKAHRCHLDGLYNLCGG